jgi:hypothetical protein
VTLHLVMYDFGRSLRGASGHWWQEPSAQNNIMVCIGRQRIPFLHGVGRVLLQRPGEHHPAMRSIPAIVYWHPVSAAMKPTENAHQLGFFLLLFNSKRAEGWRVSLRLKRRPGIKTAI